MIPDTVIVSGVAAVVSTLAGALSWSAQLAISQMKQRIADLEVALASAQAENKKLLTANISLVADNARLESLESQVERCMHHDCYIRIKHLH